MSEVDLPKYFRIEVTPKTEGVDKVDIKIPLVMLRMGMQMASLVPDSVLETLHKRLKEKGIEFDITQINPENADKVFAAMADLDINVENEKEILRVYCN